MRILARAALPFGAALVVAGAVTAAPAVTGKSGWAEAAAPAGTSWSPALVSGEQAGLQVRDGRALLNPAAGSADAVPDMAPTGLLTLPVQQLAARRAPLSYRVFATREGLVGSTTANGHIIVPNDHFVALPSRRALSARGAGDYSVKVCAANGRCAFAPVWDVGPWNTKDDYWNPAPLRQTFPDLPQGTPESQAAFRTGYHGGTDSYGRRVSNPAGIDLADGVFWSALRLRDNATVTVTYLWTGDVPLAKVVTVPGTPGASTGFVAVLAAPAATAAVVGAAGRNAGVPVTCRTGGYLRIGAGQYLPASAVPSARSVPVCAG